jgi:N-acetylglucosamine-6-phosphate deacetylase
VNMAASGFVDIQVNGALGVDFACPDLTYEDIVRVTRFLVDCGTVAYCPTLVTSSSEAYEHCLPLLARARRDAEIGPHLLGTHLEGPFISPEPGSIGVHDKRYVVPPDTRLFDRMYELAEGGVAVLTLAPDQPGAIELIAHAASRGVRVAMGHHNASNAQMEAAVQAGVSLATHIGNGIANMIHRHDNPIWWMLAEDGMYGSFVTDGHHLPPALIKTAFRTKTVSRFIAISDASSLAGVPVGDYEYGGKPVVVEESGRIFCPETCSLAGSHSTMLECMNYLASLNIMDEDDLWRVGFHNPAEFLGLDKDAINALAPNPLALRNGSFVVR